MSKNIKYENNECNDSGLLANSQRPETSDNLGALRCKNNCSIYGSV